MIIKINHREFSEIHFANYAHDEVAHRLFWQVMREVCMRRQPAHADVGSVPSFVHYAERTDVLDGV